MSFHPLAQELAENCQSHEGKSIYTGSTVRKQTVANKLTNALTSQPLHPFDAT